ncbi:MAG: YjbQ family protein, partial [Desulfobacula sp.]|nr:YjbQ family protein [Desulfobacula sp.]
MAELKCVTQSIQVDLQTGCDIKNITHGVNKVLKDHKITTGMVNIFIIGSTGSVTTIEYEPGVVEDLKHAINTLAPIGLEYAHEKAWHDGNGHSHVQAALMG